MEEATSTPKQNVCATPFSVPTTPFLKKIGYGTGVSVYEFIRSPKNSSDSPWALKKVNRQHKGEGYGKMIQNEAEMLKSLCHPNIIGFRGYTTTDDGREVLVMEECLKSLGDVIEECAENGLKHVPANDILKIMVGILKGLHYLHTEKFIVHCDIKSYNILLKDDLQVKLCDFGVSLKTDTKGIVEETVEHCRGTFPWSAPEVLHRGLVTTKSDIFSFGLVLYEMLTLKPPHIDVSSDLEDSSNTDFKSTVSCMNESSVSDYSFTEKYGTRPELPADIEPEYKLIVDIFNMCTEEDYNKRPSAEEILLQLETANVTV